MRPNGSQNELTKKLVQNDSFGDQKLKGLVIKKVFQFITFQNDLKVIKW